MCCFLFLVFFAGVFFFGMGFLLRLIHFKYVMTEMFDNTNYYCAPKETMQMFQDDYISHRMLELFDSKALRRIDETKKNNDKVAEGTRGNVSAKGDCRIFSAGKTQLQRNSRCISLISRRKYSRIKTRMCVLEYTYIPYTQLYQNLNRE